jgi:hypothetical protein
MIMRPTARPNAHLRQIMKDQFDYFYIGKANKARQSFSPSTIHLFVSFVLFCSKIVDEFIRYTKGFAKARITRRKRNHLLVLGVEALALHRYKPGKLLAKTAGSGAGFSYE